MKNVLITGASGGLGKNLVQACLDKGYYVIAQYNDNLEYIKEIKNDNLLLIKADFKNEDDVLNIYNELKNKNIKVDVLINNAGIENTCDIDDKNYDSFIDIYKVNTLAPFTLMKLFANDLESVVNISSDNTVDQETMETIEYDISKHGLNVLTKVFSDYYPSIKVNAILFGWLDTPMNDFPDDMKEMLDFVPMEKAISSVVSLIETKESGTIKLVRK